MKTLKLGPKPLTFFEEKKLIEILEYYLGESRPEKPTKQVARLYGRRMKNKAIS